jgi:hypothetical protein
LLVINYLNSQSPLSPTLSPEYRGEGVALASRLAPSAYYDVNQDGSCTPLDVLRVINELNAAMPESEGEWDRELSATERGRQVDRALEEWDSLPPDLDSWLVDLAANVARI